MTAGVAVGRGRGEGRAQMTYLLIRTKEQKSFFLSCLLQICNSETERLRFPLFAPNLRSMAFVNHPEAKLPVLNAQLLPREANDSTVGLRTQAHKPA